MPSLCRILRRRGITNRLTLGRAWAGKSFFLSSRRRTGGSAWRDYVEHERYASRLLRNPMSTLCRSGIVDASCSYPQTSAENRNRF
ncbi:hypothetical protein Bcep1808_5634 [Burkholderia vietnamiensis G4]|uniref:Uncharacterized protein n=1 Tax=Burkholderia vietnamiensis (strain G4 / LMG 22486) TaxID=269482 RepID=A4JQL9_BURVG|nr:hypothetical protein Bcep1808_5634 [Burkholderia vietnamiensis G4]